MPKYDYLVVPGQRLPENIESVLKGYFSEKDFEKLLKFGGRIQFSITAPFNEKQKRNLFLDDAFFGQLNNNPATAEMLLRNLNKEQLIEVAKKLGISISKKTSLRETLNIILSNIGSEIKWKGISGTTI
jgi:hypothetical protein